MNPSPNLFLIGPMGAGKSTLGHKLARHFDMRWMDLDTAIEERTGTTVATIFEIEGEAGFRRREAGLLAELTAAEDIVLATGGGAVLAPGNRARLRERGFVVWLQASVEQQLRRLARDRTRPLLHAPDRRERLERLASERDPLYGELADLGIASTCASGRNGGARIAALLERHWQRVATSSPIP